MLFIDNVSRSLFKTYSMKMLILSKIQIKLCDDICELLFAQIYNNKNITLNNLPTINYILKKIKKDKELRITKYNFRRLLHIWHNKNN